MKIVTISRRLLKNFQQDPEVLKKEGRPCLLVVRLKYKGDVLPFAVPLRSNISAVTPKGQYFALPPRSGTRSGNHHGLHYIKMMPMAKKYIVRYRTENDEFATIVQSVVNQNEKRIITECQKYLDDYSNGYRPLYSTDIDLLLTILKSL